MIFFIAIESGDKDHAFGVVVPDLPGCFLAGDTLDEAFDNAKAHGMTRSGFLAQAAQQAMRY